MMSDKLLEPLADDGGRIDSPGESTCWGLSTATWLRIGAIAALLAAVFWPNFRRLWLKTNPVTGEGNWNHSLFVPLIGLYYLYINRDALFSPGHRKPISFRLRSVAVWLEAQVLLWGVTFIAWAVLADTPTKELLILAPVAGISALSLLWVLAASAGGGRPNQGAKRLLSILADSSSAWFGAGMLLWGLLFYAWAIWPGQNDFFKDCSMVATLFGVVLLLGGWPVMRIAWFPIVFLVCAFPWPGLMYSKIAMPLQQLAASAAVGTLRLAGVEALNQGNTIIMSLKGGGSRALSVAEACAGLKSLMTFITLAAAIAFLSARPLWQKVLITLSAVPIAIFCNMMRVSGQGLLDHYWSQRWSEGFAHQFAGMVMLIPAFLLILLMCWILDHLFIEEVDAAAQRVRARDESVVIEIPRSSARAAAVSQAPAAPADPAAPAPQATDLASATLRMMSAQARRQPKRDAQEEQP